MSSPQVTIVIPNWNTQRWLPGCLDGLQAQRFKDFRVVVVDNGSTDDSVALIRQHYPWVELITFAENRGFAAAVNAGIRQAQTKYVALLNVDTVPQPGWLENLVKTLEESGPEVGSVAAKMLSLENPTVLDDAGNSFSWYGSAWKRGNGEPAERYAQPEAVLSASGGSALYRRAFFEDVGYFDEGFVSYLEDIDLGLRGQLRGYHCLYQPAAQVWHQWQGAQLPRPTYVFYSTRNRLSLLAKNIPGRLLLKHAPTLLYGQFYFFLVYKKPIHSLHGIGSFLGRLPHLLRQRREIQARKKIDDATFDKLLTTDLGEPSLWEIISSKFNRLFT